MSALSRKGDIASGHGCFPPTPAVSASPNVYADGIGALRKGSVPAQCRMTP